MVAQTRNTRVLVVEKPLPVFASGDVPGKLVSMVVAGVKSIPTKLTNRIRSRGCRIVVCKNLLEECPRFKNEPLDNGLEEAERRTWDNLPAISGRTTFIAERYKHDITKKIRRLEDPKETTRHEVCHVVDDYFSYNNWPISHRTQFRIAYNKDVGRLALSTKRRLFYYIQNTLETGRAEVFADVLAILCGGGCQKDCTGYSDEYFLRCFSNSRSYIERNILNGG